MSAFLTIDTHWMTAAVLAAFYGAVYAGRPPSWPKTVVRAGSVALLAWLGLRLGAPGMIVAGLFLGTLGDAFLSRPGRRAAQAGTAALAAGHLAYAAAMLRPEGLGAALLLGLPLILLGLGAEYWLRPRLGAKAWAVRGYAAVIVAMALSALSLGPGYALLQGGVLLYVISDLLLALEMFALDGRRGWRLLPRLVWLAYWTGQATILFGALSLVPPV